MRGMDNKRYATMRLAKPCDAFNNYSCGCEYCHDCGWKKTEHFQDEDGNSAGENENGR